MSLRDPVARRAYNKEYRRKNMARLVEKERERRLKNPRTQRNQHLVRLYGITIEQYEELFAKQGNQCAICATDKPGKRGWHVDHNHDTNKVRGILCSQCNVGIGMFQENVTVIDRAIVYLMDHAKKTS